MIYTVGHSTLSEEKFIQLLGGKIQTVVDVRSHPTSKWPQFRKEELEIWLPKSSVGYVWMPELGGWDKRHLALADEMAKFDVNVGVYARGSFPKQRISQKTLPTENDHKQEFLPCCKPEWTNTGLRDFSHFMSLDEFLSGANRLISRGRDEDVAIMCAEAVPWRCHRSMVSDFLLSREVDSFHLYGTTQKPHSKMIGNRLERYDEYIKKKWSK